MCALRRKLGLDRGRVSAIRTTNHGYVLDPAAAKTDLHEFRVLLQAAEGADPRAALDCLEAAVGLVTGELLAGEPHARWANQERSVLQNELVGRPPRRAARGEPGRAGGGGADGAYGGGRRRAGGGGLAVADARAVGLRPALGALRAYSELRDTLGELGADPAVETQALYLEILRDEPVVTDGPRPDGRDEVMMLMTCSVGPSSRSRAWRFLAPTGRWPRSPPASAEWPDEPSRAVVVGDPPSPESPQVWRWPRRRRTTRS